MIKYGVVTDNSYSDFDMTKKAKYLDELGTGIADEANKDKLRKPVPIVVEIEPFDDGDVD